MPAFDARGLTGDWLNAWLASIGALVLLQEAELRWSVDPLAHAVFTYDCGESLTDAIYAALPTKRELRALAIARSLAATPREFKREVTPEAYRERAAVARHRGDFSLSSSVTDLARDPTKAGVEIEHSPFDPPAPQGKTLWDRVVACHAEAERLGLGGLERTLCSRGARVKGNGLGFDYRRILSPSDPLGDVWVDPFIELLAFTGLAVVPLRGDGQRRRLRGWDGNEPRRFTWPLWAPSLTLAGVDGFLDCYWGSANKKPNSHEIRAEYAAVPYVPRAKMDQTRGFASKRI